MYHIINILNHSFYYTLANVLAQSVNFLMLPFYTRMVSVEQVGIIVILTSLFGFLNIIFQQGIGSAAGRFYFTFKRKLERVNYLNSLTSYLLLSGIVLVVLGVWVSKYLGDWLGIDSTLIAITIVISYLSAII
ncbi:MAG: Membrane protein involved in the export of O-antigen and teichoic acid, partial [Candidatus Nomurabacteria bacterium GW2011_GWA1_46_11]